jgi:hypothetical protein
MLSYVLFALTFGSGNVLAAPAPEGPAVPPELAKSLEEVAKKTYEKTCETGEFEKAYQWSRRWLEAERQRSDKKADRITAAQAHLDRMKALQKRAERERQNGQASQADVLAIEYYCVEAEIWLAQAKAP